LQWTTFLFYQLRKPPSSRMMKRARQKSRSTRRGLVAFRIYRNWRSKRKPRVGFDCGDWGVDLTSPWKWRTHPRSRKRLVQWDSPRTVC
jgi:hypothetical protein